MNPVARLLERNGDRLPQRARVLWVNAPAGFAPGQEHQEHSDFFCQDYTAFMAMGGASDRRSFGDFPPPGNHQHVVLNLPKSKARLAMMINCLASYLPAQGTLWLAGENQSGIRSAAKTLDSAFELVKVLDKARHCVLFEARQPRRGLSFDPQQYFETWTVELGQRCLEIYSLSGVFAHGRLDEGTALLAGQIDKLPEAANILDIACGSGILGVLLKQAFPGAEVVFSDTDALALASTRKTLAANQLEAKVVASDGLSGLDGRFDMVVSNPPFHDGFSTQSGYGINMLGPVRNFLHPGGQLVVVVNRHLPYRKWLDQTFGSHDVLVENSKYQVLQARMPGTRNRPAT